MIIPDSVLIELGQFQIRFQAEVIVFQDNMLPGLLCFLPFSDPLIKPPQPEAAQQK